MFNSDWLTLGCLTVSTIYPSHNMSMIKEYHIVLIGHFASIKSIINRLSSDLFLYEVDWPLDRPTWQNKLEFCTINSVSPVQFQIRPSVILFTVRSRYLQRVIPKRMKSLTLINFKNCVISFKEKLGKIYILFNKFQKHYTWISRIIRMPNR